MLGCGDRVGGGAAVGATVAVARSGATCAKKKLIETIFLLTGFGSQIS